MFGLTRRRPAIAAAGPAELAVRPAAEAPFTVAVDRLPWVMFLRVGEAFGANEAGWWLFGLPDGGALALSSDCAGLEAAVRGPLRPALDGAGARLLLELAQPPAALGGRAARTGMARVAAPAASALAAHPDAAALPSVACAPSLP